MRGRRPIRNGMRGERSARACGRSAFPLASPVEKGAAVIMSSPATGFCARGGAIAFS